MQLCIWSIKLHFVYTNGDDLLFSIIQGPTKSPPYTRDMWAFGQLVIAVVTTMESIPNDGLLDHNKICLLNDDPGVCALLRLCCYICYQTLDVMHVCLVCLLSCKLHYMHIYITSVFVCYAVVSHICWTGVKETMVTVSGIFQ